MSSAIDICNLALSQCGDEATVSAIDPPDGSVQAMHCARFYPIARDVMLQIGWNFNTRRAALSLLSEAPTFGWTYAYAWPNDALGVLAVHDAGDSQDLLPQPFQTETLSDGSVVLLTDQQSAVCRYTVRIDDTAKFPPSFVVGLGHLLESYLAGPIIKGDSGRKHAQDALKTWRFWLGSAKVADAQSNRIRPDHRPDWIQSRGFPDGTYTNSWQR